METSGQSRKPGDERRSSVLTRRQLLKRAAALGVLGTLGNGLLAACGGAPPSPTARPAGGAAQPPAAPAPKPASATAAPAAPVVVKTGGTLTVRIEQDLSMSDAHIAGAQGDFNVLRHCLEGLVAFDDKPQIIPMLAEKWTISPDGLTYTFTLRKGVPFHTGGTMKASDVKYSLERFRKLSTRRADLISIDSIATPDESTVVLKLKEADGTMMAMLANPYVVAIIPEGSAPATGATDRPVGTGPFRFEEWIQGNQVVFSRFADYKPIDIPASGTGGRKQALVDRLIFRYISDQQSALAGLETGELDFSTTVPPQDVDRLKQTARKYDIIDIPGVVANNMYINCGDPKLMSNRKFRQAVLHALDKKKLMEATYWGRGEVVPSFYPKFSVWHNEDQAYDPYLQQDLAKAKAALQEAGYSGQPLEIQAGNPEQERQAVAMQDQLKSGGINAQVLKLEKAAASSALAKGEFQVQSSGSPYRIDPDQRYSFWHSTRTAFGMNYKNPAYDKLVDDARKETDFEKRKAMYGKAHRILQDDAVHDVFYFKNNIYAASKRLQGFVANTYDWVRFENVSVG